MPCIRLRILQLETDYTSAKETDKRWMKLQARVCKGMFKLPKPSLLSAEIRTYYSRAGQVLTGFAGSS